MALKMVEIPTFTKQINAVKVVKTLKNEIVASKNNLENNRFKRNTL